MFSYFVVVAADWWFTSTSTWLVSFGYLVSDLAFCPEPTCCHWDCTWNYITASVLMCSLVLLHCHCQLSLSTSTCVSHYWNSVQKETFFSNGSKMSSAIPLKFLSKIVFSVSFRQTNSQWELISQQWGIKSTGLEVRQTCNIIYVTLGKSLLLSSLTQFFCI